MLTEKISSVGVCLRSVKYCTDLNRREYQKSKSWLFSDGHVWKQVIVELALSDISHSELVLSSSIIKQWGKWERKKRNSIVFLSKHNGQVQLLHVVWMLFSQLELLLTFKCIQNFVRDWHLSVSLSRLRDVVTLEKSTHRRCLSFNCYFLLFFFLFFLRYNSPS